MDDVKDNDKTAVSDESVEAGAAPKANGADAMKDMEELASVFAEEAPKPSGAVKTGSKTEVVAPSSNNGEASKPSETASAIDDLSVLTPKGVVVTTSEKEVESVHAITRSKEKENELTTLSGLLLVGLAGAMFYVGTVVFAKDSLIFFAGIFVYLIVAPPGTYAQGKSKMASFTKEVAVAFALTFVLFLILKSVLPPDADQAELFTIVLAILGIKLVHFPYYTTKDDDD